MSDKSILQGNNNTLSAILAGLVTDLNSMKQLIESKGGTVTVAGDIPTISELQAGLATIPDPITV